MTTISDLEGGGTYTLKTVRVKRSETATQDKATAKTIADTDTIHIQVVAWSRKYTNMYPMIQR